MSINKITIKKIFDENKDILSDDIKDGEGKITDYPPNTECNREYFAELFEGLREAKEYEDGKAENPELYKRSKGIFWIVWEEGIGDVNNGDVLAVLTECDADGNPDMQFYGNTSDGTGYVHKKTWKKAALGKSRHIRNKPWNYYPRGRVEVSSRMIRIFVNPNIDEDIYKDKIAEAFHLQESEIDIIWISDHSDHYKCLIK